MTKSPFPASRKRRSLTGRFLLLLALLAATSLACITTEIAFKLVPQQGEEGEATMTLTQHLTEAYLDSARRANVEWAQDYAAAGQEVPEILFPESWQEMGDGPMQIPEGFEIIQQDERGYIAVGTSSFAEMQDPESSGEWSLSVNRDDPERVRYLLEIEMPEVDPEFDLNELDRVRAEGLGPKPPVNVADFDPAESIGLAGLLESLGDTMSKTAEENSLEGWYAQRVLVEAGMPTIAYVIELPGEIVRHELDSQPAGVLDADAGRVTLLVDEAYMKRYGPGEYLFQVESVDQACSQECRAQAHVTWDGESTLPECVCICEQGWERNAEGTDCVEVIQDNGDVTPEATPDATPQAAADVEEKQETLEAPEADRDGDSVSDLVRDLEAFMAGEGVDGPTGEQAAVGGAAISVLLSAWIGIQLLSGTDSASIAQAVSQWGDNIGDAEPAPPPPQRQPDIPQLDTTRRPPPISSQPGPGAGIPLRPPTRTPVGEGTEVLIQRHVEDAGDYVDAIGHTRRDLQNLIDRVPDKIKNDSRWQEQVQPHLDRANESLDVEKTQHLIKEIQSLLAVRQDVDQRLQGLSSEQRDAITWTKRGLKGLGSAATESHQRVFIDPAKGAVDSYLPEQQAQQIKQVLDQHQKDIEELTRGTADLPVKGAENVFEASQRDQLADPILREDAAGVWEPREVDTPDFGRGWRKVEGWYKDSKDFLSQYIWQLRDVPKLPDD